MDKIIQEYTDEIIMKKGITPKDINKVEKELNLKIGVDLKKYLTSYGSLSFRSMELMGLGYSDNSYRNIIKATREARKEASIPLTSLVLENIGESNYVICNADNSVSLWTNGKEVEVIDRSVSDYIKRRLKEEIK